MTNIWDAVAWIGSFGVGTAVLGFVARSVFSRLLSRDLEKFKSELQRTALEHQVRFGSLHQRRAQVIGELYEILARAEEAFENAVRPARSKEREARFEAAHEAAREFSVFFRRNRVYLPKSLCDLIAKLEGHLSSVWNSIVLSTIEMQDAVTRDDRVSALSLRDEARAEMKDDVSAALAAIEASMRILLGDEEGEVSSTVLHGD